VRAGLHWYEATCIGRREMKIKAFHLGSTPMAKAAKRLFICLDNTGYEISLERLKIYVALPDAKSKRTGYLRIIDESGEDYLYLSQRFVAGRPSLDQTRGPAIRLTEAMESMSWDEKPREAASMMVRASPRRSTSSLAY
jgi:hypothetical protein